MASTPSMKDLLEPRSIAVVGASADEGKAGFLLLRNILEHGYPGKVFPVHPRAKEILGLRVYPKLREIPDPVDLVFLLIAKESVRPLLQECGEKGVKAVVIVSAGFGETGEAGAREQEELLSLLRRYGLRAIGPNTIGFVNMEQHLLASFIPFRRWVDGPVALAAQTGLFAGAITEGIMDGEVQRIGIGKSLGFGNKMDLDEVDFLEYAGEDPMTKVIGLHLESFARPSLFDEVAARVSLKKPVILLKPGETALGAKAALAHTGSSPSKGEGQRRSPGVIRAASLEGFLALLKAFSYQPLPRGGRVAVLTFSGALGVMAADELDREGLPLAEFSEKTKNTLSALLPPWQPLSHPVDLWMALGKGHREAHEVPLGATLADPGVDVLLFIALAQVNADFPEVREVFERASQAGKPILLVLQGGVYRERWMRALEGLHIPIFESPTLAVQALSAMVRFRAFREKESGSVAAHSRSIGATALDAD